MSLMTIRLCFPAHRQMGSSPAAHGNSTENFPHVLHNPELYYRIGGYVHYFFRSPPTARVADCAAVGDDPHRVEGNVHVVDPVSGRAHPVPIQRSPRPATREAFERDAAQRNAAQRDAAQRDAAQRDLQARDAYGQDAHGLDAHGPRHLADSWEGPVTLNPPLPSRR